MAAGCLSAITGLWMAVSYEFPEALQSPQLYGARVTLSIALVAFIAWAVVAIRSRNMAAHRAAMLRAFAIGQGASTQTALFLIVMIIFGTEPLGLARDLTMVAAWAVSLGVAEIVIRRPRETRSLRTRISSMP
ncbi:DUF2306 domain-containing protein [Jannaschia seohaensis]|uniref:DUF2306 domain-containing protein n=1 Tax=Jannaschia seohaensis TaxID=475081 RepID=UPI001FE8B59A|nr:DUF2306 domain-containing protein [Jannaschia seohaensis]